MVHQSVLLNKPFLYPSSIRGYSLRILLHTFRAVSVAVSVAYCVHTYQYISLSGPSAAGLIYWLSPTAICMLIAFALAFGFAFALVYAEGICNNFDPARAAHKTFTKCQNPRSRQVAN